MNAHHDHDDYCGKDMVATGLVNIAGHVMGGRDMRHLWEKLRGMATVQDVMRIFRSEGIRWGQLVEYDVVQVLSGHSPRYFLSEHKWAQIYRLRRGIPRLEWADWLRWLGFGDHGEGLRLMSARWEQQREEHEVTTALIEHGYACYREQRYFYDTQEWKDKARAFRFVAGYQCWVCGTRNVGLHVHHHSPIVSAYHKNFLINFDDCRLQVLCADCHERFHSRVVRGDLSYCFVYADSETVAEYKKELRKLEEIHGIVYNCPFCQNRIAEMYPNREAAP